MIRGWSRSVAVLVIVAGSIISQVCRAERKEAHPGGGPGSERGGNSADPKCPVALVKHDRVNLVGELPIRGVSYQTEYGCTPWVHLPKGKLHLAISGWTRDGELELPRCLTEVDTGEGGWRQVAVSSGFPGLRTDCSKRVALRIELLANKGDRPTLVAVAWGRAETPRAVVGRDDLILLVGGPSYEHPQIRADNGRQLALCEENQDSLIWQQTCSIRMRSDEVVITSDEKPYPESRVLIIH